MLCFICEERAVARQMCNKHYLRDKRARTVTRPAHRPPSVSNETFVRAYDMLLDGASYHEVAETFNIPRTTLRERYPDMGWPKAEGGKFSMFTQRHSKGATGPEKLRMQREIKEIKL
jgi:hypothetical protein